MQDYENDARQLKGEAQDNKLVINYVGYRKETKKGEGKEEEKETASRYHFNMASRLINDHYSEGYGDWH